MVNALVAALVIGALSPAPVATPSPSPTPLKTIAHVISTPFCSALRRNIAPAIGHVLDNDRIIAASKPMFVQFAKDHASALKSGGSQAAEDLDVVHLENLIGPMVQNQQRIEALLGNTAAFPVRPLTNDDKQIVALRLQLLNVLDEQKGVLDLISGLVDTQQMGELQAAGHDYDKALSPDTRNNGTTGPNGSQPDNGAPTPTPDWLVNAGIPDQNPGNLPDVSKLNTDSLLANNPILAFPRAVGTYQQRISLREDMAADGVHKAVPLCGGKVNPQPQPVPSPTP
ncbi:MAG: hypothetical protein ACXWNK_07400 [Vulcanimicrobiaceae bacterium]